MPQNVYYGIQTARAIENFPISGLRAHPEFILGTALIKRAAAETNMSLGRLDRTIGKSIVQAAREVIEGRWHDQFVVDVFQAGAGTSHNMNANEVLANRAIEILGGKKGDYSLVHPNDHVNMSQSSNDVIPTAVRLAALSLIQKLLPALKDLEDALSAKAGEFDRIIKPGRTHLQDAVPIRLGQEFSGYAAAVERGRKRLEKATDPLLEIGLGATAVGTGINTPPRYKKQVVARLSSITGFNLRPASSYFEVHQSTAAFAEVSGALRLLALELIRIANDLRLLSSGPQTALGEISLPPVQPGSSIMPGKVNPVMAEMLDMVCFHIIGSDTAIAMASQAGQLEINAMTPLIAFNLLQSLSILGSAVNAFTHRCVRGITANQERCREMAERSSALATALNPYIGYEAAAKVAQEAAARGASVRQVLMEKRLLPPEQVDRILDLMAMTEPDSRKPRKAKS
ncbi:MAG: aspartate ammonia-lyase [Chloroflexi bacterium]|nr:aspartate ammonia-lyase [Chloroflexota bacterium]